MKIKDIAKKFWLPIMFAVLTIFFIIYARTIDGWAALGYIFLASITFFAMILSLIFSFIKKYLKFKFKWWSYIIIIAVIIYASYWILRLVI